jgi:hypothetical protein
MWDFDQPAFTGRLITADRAWRTFDQWKAAGLEIGVLLFGKAGMITALGTVESARNGRLAIQGDAVGATLNLKGAQFSYGPVKTWPRWPLPPIVEVVAVQAFLTNGDWLVLAEGLRPNLPRPSLPA